MTQKLIIFLYQDSDKDKFTINLKKINNELSKLSLFINELEKSENIENQKFSISG